jgi:hypothetical protein
LDSKTKYEYQKEIGALISKSSNLAHLEEKYKDVLNEVNQLRDDITELKNRIFPTIYLGKAKHHTSKEPYIIARTPWRKGTNDYIHLRVYIGALSKFKGGMEDPEVMKIALQKMREKIQSILPPVE